MRTRTVAFWRSAVGTMLITWLGMAQSGYASSTASVFCSALTRLMNASLTSTSISRESMSTTVAMPVRVKPPPAEIGDTISPGCASLETTTPSNGARTIKSSRSCARTRTVPSATCTSLRSASSRALSAATSDCAVVELQFADQFVLAQLLAAAQVALGLGDAHLRLPSDSCARRRAGAATARRSAWCVVSSSRASSWPSLTAMPSSISTSATLPVTFDDTVAWRRATT